MKKNYEKPTLRTSSMELEGFLCASGTESDCHIHFGAAVNAFEEWESSEDLGDIEL